MTIPLDHERETAELPTPPECPPWCPKNHEVDMGLPSLPASSHFVEIGRVSQTSPTYVFIPVLVQRVDLLASYGDGKWAVGKPMVIVAGSDLTLTSKREVKAALAFESLMLPGVADLIREAAETAGILPTTPTPTENR